MLLLDPISVAKTPLSADAQAYLNDQKRGIAELDAGIGWKVSMDDMDLAAKGAISVDELRARARRLNA
jgi:hypothetical protein